jgi:hypothetical protein
MHEQEAHCCLFHTHLPNQAPPVKGFAVFLHKTDKTVSKYIKITDTFQTPLQSKKKNTYEIPKVHISAKEMSDVQPIPNHSTFKDYLT